MTEGLRRCTVTFTDGAGSMEFEFETVEAMSEFLGRDVQASVRAAVGSLDQPKPATVHRLPTAEVPSPAPTPPTPPRPSGGLRTPPNPTLDNEGEGVVDSTESEGASPADGGGSPRNANPVDVSPTEGGRHEDSSSGASEGAPTCEECGKSIYPLDEESAVELFGRVLCTRCGD